MTSEFINGFSSYQNIENHPLPLRKKPRATPPWKNDRHDSAAPSSFDLDGSNLDPNNTTSGNITPVLYASTSSIPELRDGISVTLEDDGLGIR